MIEFKLLEGFSNFEKDLNDLTKQGWSPWGTHQATYNAAGTKHSILLSRPIQEEKKE